MPTMPDIFRSLCEVLLEISGYELYEDAPVNFGVDIMATSPTDTLIAEVKWTHRPMVYRRLLYDWVPTFGGMPLDSPARKLLMVSGTVRPEDVAWAKASFGVVVWDRNAIIDEVPEKWRAEYKTYFEALDGEYDDPDGSARYRDEVAVTQIQRLKDRCYGHKLSEQLNAIDPGRSHAKQFESACEKIITFLFSDILIDPKKQSYADDGLSVLDIVYRLSPNSVNRVWGSIARDFRSRAIVFECKNYASPISPLQLYTSERYLSVHALRTVCFLITRHPPKKRAQLAAQAALRESGKLLVVLHDTDIHAMLEQRDTQLSFEPYSTGWEGYDPSLYLDFKIHELLATMPR